jgi:hypothetical protein
VRWGGEEAWDFFLSIMGLFLQFGECFWQVEVGIFSQPRNRPFGWEKNPVASNIKIEYIYDVLKLFL